MIPKQYKDETDYRKIPREYLDSNVPKGRGFVKWLAFKTCLLYTSPSPRDRTRSRMPSSA